MANYSYYNPYAQHFYQPHNSIVWVNGEQEAASYPVAPNNAVALWDSENPAIYLKQADAAGRTSMKAFLLVEREPEEKESDYATRADIATVMKSLAEMKEELESLKKKKKKGEEENE